MKRWLLIISAAGLILLILALASLWGVTTWLESTAGRVMLQNKLSDSLGLEARLEGDYSLRLFPRVLVAGEGLVLLNTGAAATAARLDAFDLRVALRPLLRQEIDIQRVSLRGGSIDIEAFNSAETAATRSVTSSGSEQAILPKIKFLEITDLLVRSTDEKLLQLVRLELRDFIAGQPAPIKAVVGHAEEVVSTSLLEFEGELAIHELPWQIFFSIDEMTLRNAERNLSGITGSVSWHQASGLLDGELSLFPLAGLSAKFGISIRTSDDFSSVVSAELSWPDGAVLTAEGLASRKPGLWVIEDLRVAFADQLVAGGGCYQTEPRPLLQLMLESRQLDVDSIRERLPDQNDAETDAADWPLDIAIVLNVATLQSEAAIAHDVRLLLGAEPDCAATVMQSNE